MADPFDDLLNSTCSILSRTSGAQDAYGQTPRTLQVVQSGVPCRVSRLTGTEEIGEKEFAISYRKIYLRPWAILSGTPISPRSSAAAAGSIELNHEMTIQVGTVQYDVIDVANPSLAYHHFEVLVKEVSP